MTRPKDPSKPRRLNHLEQREFVAKLASRFSAVEKICEYSGLTRVAVEHHLWFLEHMRQQTEKDEVSKAPKTTEPREKR